MFPLLIGVIGLAIGSFLGALTYRYPKKVSVAKGRSQCPSCEHQINWYDNIPVLSFFVLHGRCRYCKKPISGRYPLIEIGTSLMFLLAWHLFSSCGSFGTLVVCSLVSDLGLFALPYLLVVFSLLVAIFVMDLEHQIIPDSFVFLLILLSLVVLPIIPSPNGFLYLASGLVAADFLLLIHLLTLGKGMGLGDVKFALFGGMFLGPRFTLTWLFVSFLTGGMVGIILIVLGKAKFGKPVPFGPFLIIGLIATLVWGKAILKLYSF